MSDARPLERLDDWDDFVKARYAPPPATEKPQEHFRAGQRLRGPA